MNNEKRGESKGNSIIQLVELVEKRGKTEEKVIDPEKLTQTDALKLGNDNLPSAVPL